MKGGDIIKQIRKNLKLSSSKAASPALNLTIDYPAEEEMVLLGHYALRLSAEENAQVEVSIQGADWQECRFAVGHFWLDWEPTKRGPLKISARSRVGKGRWKKSEDRNCEVI